MKMYILTIGITSYNRPKELKRCLESIDSKYYKDIEIVVSEDKSPKTEEIRKVVYQYSNHSAYKVTFNSNIENLGYDRNLKKLSELASGKYLMYMSDDDMFMPHVLDHVVDDLRANDYGVYYNAEYNQKLNRFGRSYRESGLISNGPGYLRKRLYDAILFSGLTFKTENVRKIDAERFLNKNYFQIYLFLDGIYKEGGYYDKTPVVCMVGDGENGYGLSDSAEKKELLADRKSELSVLEFHKGLIYVIKTFDNENKTDIIKSFEKIYNKRSIVGMSIACKSGKKMLKSYWVKMNGLDIHISIRPRIYYMMLMTLGYKNVDRIASVYKKASKVLNNGLNYG